jgi:spermidine synthase
VAEAALRPAEEPEAAGGGRGFPLVVVCFVLSGFAALLYQTVWTREFAFVFGTSELAVATVLAAYMGGLAAGSAIAGRLAPRIRRPVLAYGLLELAIAAAALGVPLAIHAARRLTVAFFGGAPEPPSAAGVALPAFRLVASFAILLVPTALMGATLPLLARHAIRREEELGPRIAWLYAANTAGAVGGTLCAAFALLPALGLRASLGVGASANAVVFAIAALLARRAPPLAPAAAATALPRPAPAGRTLVLPLMLASGAVSFACEVLWTRLLGHVLGGSVYAFATMLASFLVGIGAGSAAASRWTHSPETALRAFPRVQIGIGLASLAAFWALDALTGAGLLGARIGLAGSVVLAGAVLLPTTLLVGATFPLAVRTLARSEADAGPASARVYAWNTVGAIAGAIGAGFFAVPALGYEGTAALCAGIGFAIACSTALAIAPRAPRVPAVAALLLGLLVATPPDRPERLLRSSPLAPAPLPGEIAFFAVGRSATVIAIEHEGGWKLRTNGLPEAMILPPDRAVFDPTNLWLSALPTLARPDARSLLVIGLGGGLVLDGVPASIEAIDVIELEPQVIEANRALAGRRGRDPLADPRLALVENDARGALELTYARWNGIVSQPSHPWTAGASHLYTREFFELVRQRLEPGGVFVQWMGLGFIDAELLRSLVATLADVFPHVAVLRPGIGASLLFAGSDAPLDFAAALAAARTADPAALDALGLRVPEDVASQVLLDDAGARAFSRGAAVSTDDRNLLQMRSPRILGSAIAPDEVAELVAPCDPLEPPRGLDAPRLVRRMLETGQPARAARIAGSVEDPARRREAEALVAAATANGADRLRAVVAADPDAREAAAALVLLSRAALASDTADPVARAAAIGEPAAALVAAWRAEAGGDSATLRALDPRLAAVDHAFFAEAMRLRIEARLATGDRRDAEEAVALADRLAARVRRPASWIARVRALAASGRTAAALGDLEEIAGSLGGERVAPRFAQRLLAVLAAIPPDPALAERRAALERRLHAASTRGSVAPAETDEGDGA